MQIILERKKCIGCGSCQAVCPKYFELIEDGKSRLVGSEEDVKTGNEELEVKEADCITDAAEACPVQIIHIK